MTWLVEHREILDGYRAGQREAWVAIVEHYHGDLHRFARRGFTFTSQGRGFRFGGFSNPLDVDDVVQEVFLRAFSPEARLGYDGLHSFGNYLLGIARNVVLRDLRRSLRLVPLDEEDPLTTEVALPQPDAERMLADRELGVLLQAFEESLSHHDRRFFQLRFRQQLGQDEVATRMGLSRARVRTGERRVRKRLSRFLRERDRIAAHVPARRTAALQALLGVLA